MNRAAATGKTGKTAVLPGFSAGKTRSYLDFQKKTKVLSRKHNQPFPYYFYVTMKQLITFLFNSFIKFKAIFQCKMDENLKILNFLHI